MTFAIITHVPHIYKNENFYAYAPYVREMNVWGKYVDNIELVASISKKEISSIHLPYTHSAISITKIPSISLTSYSEVIKSLVAFPIIIFKLFLVMRKADHIHLRCPGNIGLIGCMVQVLFPNKLKTAKYAGNWDPMAKQPLSYRIQKWILSNTLLTKNMKVLVYGDWGVASKNVVSFFTATFHASEIEIPLERNYRDALNFIFVGGLVNGKRPLFVIKVVEALHEQGHKVKLDTFGDGVLKTELEQYISKHNLEAIITLHGNQSKDLIKEALRKAHFLISPSKSEGWPKAVAEAMFFGTIPIATSISCVPTMLDFGNRGILIEPILENAVSKISNTIKNKNLKRMSKLASEWSQNFTLEYFEGEIKKLLID
ncbi:MAG: glycosyltransferase family 1 protein [Bacteroidetes bacterium]|nr:MAG: glycosyltransferase family 1 protein [Bacteroidota bacterium]